MPSALLGAAAGVAVRRLVGHRPGTPVAERERRLVLIAALAPLAVAVLIVLMIVVLGGAIAGSCGGEEAPGSGSLNAKGIPSRYVPLYEGAARRYGLGSRGPAMLASIHQTETDFGRLNRVSSSAGAQGHMQFMPATWRMYGVDADGDGRASQYSAADAIYSAARYLRASGAPGSWERAVFAYNHAGWYVAKILAGAERFGDPGGGLGTANASTNSGGCTCGSSSPATAPAVQLEGGTGRTRLRSRYLSGDTDVSPALFRALERMARGTHTRIHIDSGGRTMAEQERLYARYQAGSGNLAARPNAKAPHVRGVAADIGGGARGRYGGVARRYGLAFTVAGESWHVELADPSATAEAAVDDALSGNCDQGGGGDRLARMKQEADRIHVLHLPYVLGGGHSTPAPARGPYDCSSSWSRLLQAAGYRIPTMDSGQLARWGEPGPGEHVTIYADAGHVYGVIDGRAWGTGSGGRSSGWTGAGWLSYGHNPYRGGFAVRHPPGL